MPGPLSGNETANASYRRCCCRPRDRRTPHLDGYDGQRRRAPTPPRPTPPGPRRRPPRPPSCRRPPGSPTDAASSSATGSTRWARRTARYPADRLPHPRRDGRLLDAADQAARRRVVQAVTHWLTANGATPTAGATSGWTSAPTTACTSPAPTSRRTASGPGSSGCGFGSDRPGRSSSTVDAHSELMKVYPWGETKPADQTTYNLPDTGAVDGRSLLFREQGTPPVANAERARLRRARRLDADARRRTALGPELPRAAGRRPWCARRPVDRRRPATALRRHRLRQGHRRRPDLRRDVPAGRPHGLVLGRRLRPRRGGGPRAQDDALADPDRLLRDEVATRIAADRTTHVSPAG